MAETICSALLYKDPHETSKV